MGQVKVIGLGLPNENKRYVREGVTNNIILWRTEDLGSLTLRAAVALIKGDLKAGDQTLAAGSLGNFQVQLGPDSPREALCLRQGEHRPIRFLT